MPKLTKPFERRFRAKLLNAATAAPNFAGHYRLVTWGCGSECIEGAVVDLSTGRVSPPPLSQGSNAVLYFSFCQSAYEGSSVDVKLSSRLMILRCGLNYNAQLNRNVPDVYYFVLNDETFRKIAELHGKNAVRALK